MKRNLILALTIASLVMGASRVAALAQQTQNMKAGAVKIAKVYEPEKRLEFEVEVPATPAEVWAAFTTYDGLKSWLAPDVKVDLKNGGDWLAMFGPSTGGGTILEFTPGQSLTVSALAPDSFPTVRRERTRAVFTIAPAAGGNATIVRLVQTGWRQGEEWDKAYEYLARGNAMLLATLRQRFVTGPIDWQAMMKSAPPK